MVSGTLDIQMQTRLRIRLDETRRCKPRGEGANRSSFAIRTGEIDEGYVVRA